MVNNNSFDYTLVCHKMNSIQCMPGVSQQQLAELLLSATAATDVGLLASQLCYHSMLVPCWFTLWTSSRFLYRYIFLISLEIFLFSCSIIIE